MNDEEIHAGYQFEEGMFSRVRSWVDLAPWLRLVRVLRILGSPVHVAMVSLASLASILLFGAVGAGALGFRGLAIENRWSFDTWLEPLVQMWVSAGWWNGGILILGLVLIWMPAVQSLARAGAALTADRGLPASRQTLKLVYLRLWKSFLVPLVPLLCVVVLSLGIACDSTSERLVRNWLDLLCHRLSDRRVVNSFGDFAVWSTLCSPAWQRCDGLRIGSGPDRFTEPGI